VTTYEPPTGTVRITCDRCGTKSLEPLAGRVMCRSCGTQVRPRSLDAKRFLLDSNAYDYLVVSAEIQYVAIDVHKRGLVEYLMTSIQVDQISKVPDADRRNAMSAIPFVITPTYGLVLGLSKVGLARFGEPERVAAIDSAAGNHTEDALLATTAAYEEAVLVTKDHRLRSRAIAEGGEVWWPQEFVDYIRSL